MRYNPNTKYCPLRTAADGLMAECTELCAWHVDEWDDGESIHDAGCAMRYMMDVSDMLRIVADAAHALRSVDGRLEDINLTLQEGGNSCR